MVWIGMVVAVGLTAGDAVAQDTACAAAFQASNDLEDAGHYREALDALASAPDGARERYVYQLRRAWLLYLAGDHRDAVEAYRGAIAAEPGAVEPRLGLLLPQMALHLWLDAEQTAAEVLELEPGGYLANSRHAWILYNLGRFAEAEAAYRRVLAAYPSDVDMQSGLGWSLLEQGKGAEAIGWFRAVLEVAPRHTTARQGLEAVGGG
jgi:tetratricopeptide (TPR) repeat protein